MQRRAFLLIAAAALAGCSSDGESAQALKRPTVYMPPDPETAAVGYVEIKRDTGFLGIAWLRMIDEQTVIDPQFRWRPAVDERYAAATKTVAWSDGRETVFVAVPEGVHSFDVYFAPGMGWDSFNPFTPSVLAYIARIEARVARDGQYRIEAAQGPGGTARVWLKDIRTGEVIGSASIE